jgi:nucleoside-diphosphate-sugar epimerase
MVDEPLLDNDQALLARMTAPTAPVREAVSRLDGDVLILGVGGKMGPSLAELLVRAGARRVIGVSRFSDDCQRRRLESVGVRTIAADLLDELALIDLPEAPYVYLLAGFKFGATGNEPLTWAMNTWLPGRVLQRYPQSRVVYVSSGNVYAFTRAPGPGAAEDGELAPVGEYAQSRLGGERVAAHFARAQGTPLAIVRLFYASEPRYGIVHDLAWKVFHGEPIDLRMGWVNQIWQGDANACLARLFPWCDCPPAVVNLTGPTALSVRWLAERLGEALGKEPTFTGNEADTALLGDASRLLNRLQPDLVAPEQLVAWVAHWVRSGGHSLGKPTKFESRTGRF